MEQGKLDWPDLWQRAAELISGENLGTLVVNHSAPKWASADPTRFPADLLHVYSFYRRIAQRFTGKAIAVEIWNEPDLEYFGGHLGSEIATFQKAASLGLRSVTNPKLTVGAAPFSTPNPAILEDFSRNRPHAYSDTFNFHHYVPPELFGEVYRRFRLAANGAPIWVTECNQPVWWEADPERKALSAEKLHEQSARVAKLYASSL